MNGAGQHPNKQTNRLRDTETEKYFGRKCTKGKKEKDILTNRGTSKLNERDRQTDRKRETHTERLIDKLIKKHILSKKDVKITLRIMYYV